MGQLSIKKCNVCKELQIWISDSCENVSPENFQHLPRCWSLKCFSPTALKPLIWLIIPNVARHVCLFSKLHMFWITDTKLFPYEKHILFPYIRAPICMAPIANKAITLSAAIVPGFPAFCFWLDLSKPIENIYLHFIKVIDIIKVFWVL